MLVPEWLVKVAVDVERGPSMASPSPLYLHLEYLLEQVFKALRSDLPEAVALRERMARAIAVSLPGFDDKDWRRAVDAVLAVLGGEHG